MAHLVTWHSCRETAGCGALSELDFVLFELPVQGPAADAEEAGGLGLVVASLLQGLANRADVCRSVVVRASPAAPEGGLVDLAAECMVRVTG